ncbi:MAG: GDP-mannose 4,6-dehydratase [bacterium]|jgi:UDP-glucuronate 4-epimerase|nr:GDP-mannose 4,6-dehydratase [candidate division KSB1 bacterium]MDH7559957.1 GDP-mannose 4,6-dehydratase [bacterium]
MRILLTGAAGFIGSHLGERLLVEGHSIVGLDDFNDFYDPKVKRDNLRGLLPRSDFRLVEGDILDYPLLEQVFAGERFDAVIHLAARAGVRPSIREPLLYQEVNCRGTNNLLEMAKRHGVHRFIFASSSSVYGANRKVPFAEDDPVDHPVSPYAATKKAGELLCYTYHHLFGISVSCLRFFTVYGPRQRPDMAIHKFTRLIDAGAKVPMFGDGSSRRDYTFITDIIDGLVAALDRCQGYAIYNLGESRTVELSYLISLISSCLGREAKVERLPEQPGDVPITYADISRARKELDYAPKVPIEEGIERFVQWYRAQQETANRT